MTEDAAAWWATHMIVSGENVWAVWAATMKVVSESLSFRAQHRLTPETREVLGQFLITDADLRALARDMLADKMALGVQSNAGFLRWRETINARRHAAMASIEATMTSMEAAEASLAPLLPPPAPAEPAWIIRHRIVLVVIMVVLVALAEPAINAALPPELRHLLELEHGPLAYSLAIVGAIVGTAAVTGRKS